MAVSKDEYKRIVTDQLAGRLTIFIDTSAFRKLFVNKINPQKLSAAIGEPVESRMQIIRALTLLDSLAPLLASIVAFIAFGWFGVLGVFSAFTLWSVWKMYACRGSQTFMSVIMVLIVFAAVMFVLHLSNGWGSIFFALLGIIIVTGRLLYLIFPRKSGHNEELVPA